jgi:hypothetical protein
MDIPSSWSANCVGSQEGQTTVCCQHGREYQRALGKQRETKEAWGCLKGWYKAASNASPAASQQSLTAQTAEWVDLYRKVPTPGDPLQIHVDKVNIPDGPPSDGELRDIVRGLRNGPSTSRCGSAMSCARTRRRVMYL